MYRIQVDENTGTEWKPIRKMYADGFLAQGIREDGIGTGANLQTWVHDVYEADLPLMLSSGRELCVAVIRAFPRALWMLLTAFARKGEEGWD